MAKTGFIVFGRPVTHKYVSNGLFKDLNLESETYMEFPNEFGLKKSIASISRQLLNDGTQLIKIYLFEHAISFDNRAGGFVGSGIAFIGIPTHKLLYSELKKLHSHSRTLVDENRQFKKASFDKNDIVLNEANTEGLISANYNSKAEISNEKYGLKIDGPILLHIMSAVQGFMFNPNFKKIKTLYVSESKELLQHFVDPRKVLSFGHLLNYEAMHKAQHQQKASLDKELKILSEELKTVKKNIESENNELKKLSFQLKQKNDELISLNEKFKRMKHQFDSNTQTIKNQEKILEEIKTQNYRNFQSLLNDKRFHQERDNYEKKITNQVQNLQIELKETEDELKKTKAKSNRRTVIGSIVTLFLVTAMFFAGSFYGAKQAQPVIVEKTESKPVEKLKTIDAPTTYPLSEFLKMPHLEQENLKVELDKFIDDVMKADEEYDLSNFYERDWHFAEIIDYNEDSIDIAMERFVKIRNFLKKQNKTIPVFEMQFLLPTVSEEGFTQKEIDFKTDKRNDILKQYLKENGNVYDSIGLNIGDISNFEKEMPLLYMHFRWMVFNLSSYEKDGKKTEQADIYKTSQTKHTVLIKK
jgi:hypothetical protein